MIKIKTLILASLTIALTSCSFFDHLVSTSTEGKYPFQEGKTVEGKPIKYSFDIKDKDIVNEEMSKLYDLAVEAKDWNKFVNSYNKASDYYTKVLDAYYKESLKYDMYGESASNTLKLQCYDLYLEMYKTFNKVHHIVYKNDFKDLFFEDMSEEEIIEYIGPEYDDEYYEYDNKAQEIEAEYDELDEDSASFDTSVDSLYVEYVKTQNKKARLLGYDNYLAYAYKEVFDRSYEYEDTKDFYTYIKDYVYPYYISLEKDVKNKINDLSYSQRNKVSTLFEGNGFLNFFDLIDDYKEYFGGEYKTTFDDLWYESQNYYISYDDKATHGAYTSFGVGDTFTFFGNRFEAFTIVHEFGHYYNDAINGSDGSYDLFETHSQANEMLFAEYLYKENKFDIQTLEVIKEYQELDMISSIIVCASVNELEKMVYEDSELTLGETDAYVDELYRIVPIDKIFNLKKYWRYVAITSAGYYVSYATSAIGALQVYHIAEDNLRKGIDAYDKLINRQRGVDDLVEIYRYAGLSSPFEKQTFIDVFKN